MCINYAAKYDFKYTIVRYHNVYGPNMGHEHVIPQFIRKLSRNEEFFVEGNGSETRSFCFIDDAIDGTIIVDEDESVKERIFNIGKNDEIAINDLISLLSKVSEKSINPIYQPKENSGTNRRNPDITKAKSVGYLPKISLLEGLSKTYDWYHNYYTK